MLHLLRRFRFTPLRRIPFPALALGVCLVFAAVGAGTLDDYGVGADETHHRETSIAIADYILGNPYEFPTEHDRFYGATFEMLLLLAERGLGLQDSRSIHLVRHIMIHLFFIVGGFCCGLLAYRMFGSRWIALLAMLLFLLHPRLYAHSFFNISERRKRIAITGAIVVAAGALTFYIISPFLWENPFRVVEWVKILSQHPAKIFNLFLGRITVAYEVPPHYIPVWFSVTGPPVALLLGGPGRRRSAGGRSGGQ